MTNELYDKNIQCPVCKDEFSTKKVRTSSIRVMKRDEDFCPYYKSENPLYYSVFVCPHCGYSAMESEFSKIIEVNKVKIKKTIGSKWKPRSYGENRSLEDAIEAYKLALLSSQIIEASNNVIGKICLRLAWFYRYQKDNKETEFIKYAINAFKKTYIGERLDENKQDEIIILYLLGELNRRIGDYKESIKWFDKALSEPEIKKKRHIELKARDQWGKARDEYKKIKNKAANA